MINGPKKPNYNSLFKKQRQKSKSLVIAKVNPYRKLWQTFCNKTTYEGLRYIGGTKRQGVGFSNRLLWTLLYLSQVGCCVLLSHRLWSCYFRFEVKTSFTYNNVGELEFPAITFCNLNTFRKSTVGGNYVLLYNMANYFSNSAAEREVLLSQNNATCYKKHANEDVLMDALLALKKGFVDVMMLLARQSKTDVMKCWWSNKDVECSKIFSNHANDFSLCFSFNQDKLASESKNSFDGYGPKDNETGEKIIKIAGSHAGLRLLLNVGQDDYCGAIRKYRGAGFYVQVHDPKAQSLFQVNPSLSLQPGYQYEIVISPTHYIRRTEHLGKCLSNLPLSLYPQAKHYVHEACIMQCITEIIWAKCQCFPFNFEGQDRVIAKAFNLKEEEIFFCAGDKTMCMHLCTEYLLNSDIFTACPRCKEPCEEKIYTSVISAKKFPTAQFKNYLSKELNAAANVANDTRVEKNYLSVNFYFKNMNLLLIEDNQDFPPIELALTFGWAMSLFLGGSYMTPFEVVFYFFKTIELMIKRCFKKETKKRVVWMK